MLLSQRTRVKPIRASFTIAVENVNPAAAAELGRIDIDRGKGHRNERGGQIVSVRLGVKGSEFVTLPKFQSIFTSP